MDTLTDDAYLASLLIAFGTAAAKDLGSRVSDGLKALVAKFRAHCDARPKRLAKLQAAEASSDPEKQVAQIVETAREDDGDLDRAIEACHDELKAWYEAQAPVQQVVNQTGHADHGSVMINTAGTGNQIWVGR
jgi:hypothetical protein